MEVKVLELLLRFMDSIFVEDFLKGKIYMKSNKSFSDLEKESNVMGIGDRYEGSFLEYITPDKSNVFIVLSNGSKVPINFERMTVAENSENVLKFPILCSTLLDETDFKEVENNEYSLNEETITDLLRDFSDRTCVAILNIIEFEDRINSALKKVNLRALSGRIKYFNNEYPLSRDEFKDDPRKALFYKRDFYKYQREYRMVIEFIEEDFLILDIGDISDIAFVISDLAKVSLLTK